MLVYTRNEINSYSSFSNPFALSDVDNDDDAKQRNIGSGIKKKYKKSGIQHTVITPSTTNKKLTPANKAVLESLLDELTPSP